MSRRGVAQPWRIHFFLRSNGSVPSVSFLDELPTKVAAEIQAVLEAVATAPPPAFSGGGKWEAMHGDMHGIYEVRVRQGRRLFRLFCLLQREAADLGGPSIVCLGGLCKPTGTTADERDYERIRAWAAEFRRSRSVL
jgi:Txe/YoeB family toxin of Txe-Axe toxin-antitoxin module